MGDSPRFRSNFTDKVPFFADLSVKQNVFYGQTIIFRRFVRKFLAIMREIYGQKTVFGAFVRKTEVETSKVLRTNSYFSSGPFTDKEPIFIDLSVNGSDFAKGSAAHHLLNHCT